MIDTIKHPHKLQAGFSVRKFVWTCIVAILAILAIPCFIFSAAITKISLEQPNNNFLDTPVDLSKPSTYRTDFSPPRFSLGIEFLLAFDDLYLAKRNLEDLEVLITVSNKAGHVLFEQTKTKSDFRLNRIKSRADTLRCTFGHTPDLKGDFVLEFKVINPAIEMNDKGQYLTAGSMRTGMEMAYAIYTFIIGLVFSVIAFNIIKRLCKSKL